MDFSHYANVAVELVNGEVGTVEGLRSHLADDDWLIARIAPSDPKTLDQLRGALAAIVDASASGRDAEVVDRLNDLLARNPIRPRISGHDASDLHLHVNEADAPVAEVLAAEALFGLTLLVTEVGANRLGRCAARDCHRAFVDTSTNHSRRFCSSRCATRTNVANYRERQRRHAEASEEE